MVVKYSIVVLICNLILCLILMIPFGHVGIASATTCASFVSLYQYLRGLKKRGHWQISKLLKIKILKIIFCSLIMGSIMLFAQSVINYQLTDWLTASLYLKFTIFAFLGLLGIASFLVMAKITKVLNISEIITSFSRKKGKDNA